MNMTELQATLQDLTKAKITQEQIGNALGITRSTVNTRMKNNSQLKLEEIPKIEKFFGVTLKDLQMSDKYNELCKQVLLLLDGSDSEKEVVNAILTSKPTRKTFVLFFKALQGEASAISVVKSMLDNEEIVKVFLGEEWMNI